MKKLFYTGVIGLTLFEILNVYFIMPMPGSQQMNSIGIAYFLYAYRWVFRAIFGLLILIGSTQVFKDKRFWIPIVSLVPLIVVAYYFNFKMTADHMFLQPETLTFKSRADNTLSDSSIVIAVANKGEAKAYPVRYIMYHHQVRDTVGGKSVMVTYCNVCRTGRVFEPLVNGQPENFRLVGMDHFNAMFEDHTTKSWWRQATGESLAGPLKGTALPEVESEQLTLNKFFLLYPFGKVMQPDMRSNNHYDSLARFERGKSKGKLTRTDSLSWKNKSWVVGINAGTLSKAYDWNDLMTKRIINDKIGDTPVLVVLSDDNRSFVAFQRPSQGDNFTVRHDTLFSSENKYDFSGRNTANENNSLKRINAYQEFWHSWRTFHPTTLQYH